VPDLPFALWLQWYRHEAAEPFQDRRCDLQAFLICRVLSGVIHQQIEPTEEMFRLSAAIDGSGNASDDDERSPASPRSLLSVRANFARCGINSYIEGE
jgi:hypothetical protein